jgi:hypothetical protein
VLALSTFVQVNSAAKRTVLKRGAIKRAVLNTVESFDLKLVDRANEDALGVEMEMDGKSHFHKTKLGS